MPLARLPASWPLLAMLFALNCEARWATEEDVEFTTDSIESVVTVKKDGSYLAETRVRRTVKKESGIDDLKITREFYDPNISEKWISEAATINGAERVPVAPSAIENKPVASRGEGFSSRQQISIPFPALRVGSTITYVEHERVKASFVPGLFSMKNVFGVGSFVKRDELEIRSEVPLFVKSAGTAGLVSVKEERRGPLYVVKMKQLEPLSRIPIGEAHPLITAETFPVVEISSAQDWGAIAKAGAAKIDTALAAPLPPEFAAIAKSAAAKADTVAKIETVVNELVAQVKYLGDWRKLENYHFPRALQTIADTKQGDCKDFSLVTAAILNQLGMKARVAWIERGMTSASMVSPLLPSLRHFNHAITYVEAEGKTFWVDPTNTTAFVRYTPVDIAGREALVLDDKSTKLAVTPTNLFAESKMEATAYHSFRPGNYSDAMAGLRMAGPWGTTALQLTRGLPPERRTGLVFLFVNPEAKPRQMAEYPEAVALDENFIFGGGIAYSSTYDTTKTSFGPAITLPSPISIVSFLQPVHQRVTGIELGAPGRATKKLIYRNFRVKGEKPADCKAESKWGSASRAFSSTDSSFVVDETIDNTAYGVTTAEMQSPDFLKFQKELGECFQPTMVAFTHVAPDPKETPNSAPENPLIRDKSNLLERQKKIARETKEKIGDLLIGKMLLDEQLRQNPQDAAAYAQLGFMTYRLAYISGEKFEPAAVKEATDLLAFAKSLNPDDIDGKLLDARLHLMKKNYSDARIIARQVLAEKPDSISAKMYLMEGYAAEKQHKGALIRICEEGLKKPDVSLEEKKVYRSQLLDLYAENHEHDPMERVHRGIVDDEPDSAWALLNFAGFLVHVHKYEEAEEYARRSLKAAPTGMARNILAQAMTGRSAHMPPTDARRMSFLREAMENDPSAEYTRFLFAESMAAIGKQEKNPGMVKLAEQYEANNLFAQVREQRQARDPASKMPVYMGRGVPKGPPRHFMPPDLLKMIEKNPKAFPPDLVKRAEKYRREIENAARR